MNDATAVSLFSGIGGLDHGLQRAGWRHLLMCESDPWRRDVLRARFPGIALADDVREVDATTLGGRCGAVGGDGARADAERNGSALPVKSIDVGLLCGGFPCQDLSVAGQRRGLAGDRSGLFHEYARIAGALRPRWLLVENVPGLLSSQGGRDFGVVLATLADLGYGLAWRILDSRYFGVPQRRRRVFIVGARADDDPRAAAERAGQVLAVGTRCPGHPPTGAETRPDVAVASLSGLGTGGPDDNDGQGGRLIACTLKGEVHDAGEDGSGRVTLIASPLSHGSNPNSNMAGRRREDDINLVAGPLGCGNDIGRRSQDDPNLVAWPLARRGRDGESELEVGEANVYNALRAGDGGSSRLNQILTAEASVRRLTPRECERLQNLPDDWTLIPDSAPDSRRYAALGDAVTASVGEWIGGRLLAVSRGVL